MKPSLYGPRRGLIVALLAGIGAAPVYSQPTLASVAARDPDFNRKMLSAQAAAAGKKFTVLQNFQAMTAAATVLQDSGINALAGTDPSLFKKSLQRSLTVEVDVALPPSFDSRTKMNASLPLQDQKNCGSCWVFGAICAYEANYLYQQQNGANGTAVNASEQFPLNCLRGGPGMRTDGCGGGWPGEVLDLLFDGSRGGNAIRISPGTATRSEFPYQARTLTCSPISPTFKAKNRGYVNDSVDIPREADIKKAILKYGAVVAAVKATNAFVFYNGGVFDETNTFGTNDVNHAICLIGWDDHLEGGSWLLRNSWGPSWGRSDVPGHMWIKYRSNNVGFGAMFVEAVKNPGDGRGGDDGNCPPPRPAPLPNPGGLNEQINQEYAYWTSKKFVPIFPSNNNGGNKPSQPTTFSEKLEKAFADDSAPKSGLPKSAVRDGLAYGYAELASRLRYEVLSPENVVKGDGKAAKKPAVTAVPAATPQTPVANVAKFDTKGGVLDETYAINKRFAPDDFKQTVEALKAELEQFIKADERNERMSAQTRVDIALKLEAIVKELQSLAVK